MEDIAISFKEFQMYLINIKLFVIFIISIILLLCACYIGRKTKTNKKRESVEGLISPILAEVLIDGKIDIKNLIMTTIVELQIKRNIEVINDDSIRLIHKDNLDVHEYLLVNTIFENEKIIKLEDIDKRFTYSQYYGASFVDNITNISNEIQIKLYKMKLFSRKKMITLNIVSYLAMLIFVNLPTVLLGAGFNEKFTIFFITATTSVAATWMYFTRLTGKPSTIDEISAEASKKGLNLAALLLIAITIVVATIVFSIFNFEIYYILEIAIIYLINLKTFKLAKNNVLSDEGLKERQKILELKNYLNINNLIKKDGTESYIEWNEYFAYSVAFGISNPVTSEIYKKWKNLNVTLRFIDNLI